MADMYSPDSRADLRIRPRQVKVAAILLVVFGVLGVAVTWFLLLLANQQASEGASVGALIYTLVYGQIVVSAAQVASGVFVWQGRSWARKLAIVICGLNVLGGVFSLISGTVLQAITGIVLNSVVIRLLLRDEVRDWCR